MARGRREGLLILLAVLFFLIGFWRLMALVSSDRVIGYANNYDMIRLESCLGVTPRDYSRDFLTPEKTLQFYGYDRQVDPQACLPSSQQVLYYPAIAFLAIANLSVFDLRLVGVTQAVIVSLFVGAMLVQLIRKKRAGAAVFLTLVFALVFTDPVNTLFLNTFYAEPATFIFFFAAVTLGYYQLVVKPSWIPAALFAACLLGLGFSKLQFIFFPIVLGLLFGAAVWLIHKAPLTLIFSCFAIALSLAGMYQIYRQPVSIIKYARRANSTDTISYTLLPLFDDQERALSAMGMPANCVQIIGKSWYNEEIQQRNPCPEVWSVGKGRILASVAGEPLVVYRLLKKSLSVFKKEAARGIVLPYLATDRNGDKGGFLTWGAAFAHFQSPHWAVFLAFPLILMLASGIGIALQWMNRRSFDAILFLNVVLAACFYLVFFSSVFGDGWIEFIKHNLLMFDLFVVLLIAAVFSIIR